MDGLRAHLGVVNRVHNKYESVCALGADAWHDARLRRVRLARRERGLRRARDEQRARCASAHGHLHARARRVKGKRGTRDPGCAPTVQRAAPKRAPSALRPLPLTPMRLPAAAWLAAHPSLSNRTGTASDLVITFHHSQMDIFIFPSIQNNFQNCLLFVCL